MNDSKTNTKGQNMQHAKTLIDQMLGMKKGETTTRGRYVVKHIGGLRFRLGEIAGDWITTGSAPVIAARVLSQ